MIHTPSSPAVRSSSWLDEGWEQTDRRILPRMPLLLQQSLREILTVFLLVLAVSTALTTLVGVSVHLIDHGISGRLLFRVLPFIVPSMLPFTIPASYLLAVILVYGRMSGDSELTAVKAAGINVVRLLTLPVVLGALLSGLTFLLTDQLVPWAATRIELAIMKHVEEMLVQQLTTSRQAVYPPADLKISVAGMRGQWMIRPVIQHDAGHDRRTLVAAAARLAIDTTRQQATLQVRDATLFLTDGDKATFAGDHSFPISGPVFQSHRPSHFVTLAQIRQRIDDEQRTIREQRRQLARATGAAERDPHLWTMRYAQESLNKLRTEVHSRYALACSCLCFALFGCPLAAALARGKLMTNLLFCFFPIVGIYYTIVFGMAGQCRNGVLDPAWAMWTGDAVLVLLAAWLFYRLASR